MRIVHVAKTDICGGAARAAYRIHTGLRQLGHESVMYVGERKSDDPRVMQFKPGQGLGARVGRRIQERWISRALDQYDGVARRGFDVFSDDRAACGRDWFEQLPAGDVINLHWVGGFVDFRKFFSRIPKDTPIVWRLADMNPFTGGCHFDYECGKFVTGCGSCPQLGSKEASDLSRRIWERKSAALNGLEDWRLHIVVLNELMVETVKATPILGRFRVSVIPNGLDTTVFAPRDKRMAREILGIPVEGKVVLFAADYVSVVRKGLSLLVEALRDLAGGEPFRLVSMGGDLPTIPKGIDHRHLGRIHDDLMLSLVYSAADVFVFPSLQETFGQTALESMACGTPVIGFDGVGCIPGLVQCGVTGWKVPLRDVKSLGRAIAEALRDDKKLREMSLECRRTVLDQYNLEIQARRYAQLYQSLVRPTGSAAKEA